MRSTALAYKDEQDEVPMSSQEVLEANVAAIRSDLNELKTDFRAAVTRLDQRIDVAVSKLESEIRAMAEKAAQELREFAARIEKRLDEMRAVDETLSQKIDKTNERLDKTNEKLGELTRTVDRIDGKLNAFFWVIGVLTAIFGAIAAAGKAFHWF